MVTSDAARRLLYDGLVAGLGQEVADVLMDHLPPSGWSDLATKDDVHILRAEMGKDMAALTATFHRDMVRQTWILAGTLIAALGTIAGLLH